MNWEDDLRQAHVQHEVAQEVISWRLPLHEVMVGHLTNEEEVRFRVWKAWYIFQPADFKDGMMAAAEFDLVE